ncbi:MAG: hypothetical protein ACRYGP_07970 [Janthinobacterium lividum]
MAENTLRDDPVAAARALIPALRERATKTEIACGLLRDTERDLHRWRLFDMLVPSKHGGRQASLTTFMDVVVELGRGDGSTAWVVSLLAANTWMLATLFPQKVTDPIFASGRFCTAGAVMPRSIRTRQTSDGILVEEGTWSFNSGIRQADWDILGIPIFGEDGTLIDSGSALVPVSEITLLDDWDTLGLRGTGSTSVQLRDVFVPHERIAPLSQSMQGDYASGHLRGESLYRIALLPFLVLKDAFPLLGMANAALELFRDSTTTRAIPYMDRRRARTRRRSRISN